MKDRQRRTHHVKESERIPMGKSPALCFLIKDLGDTTRRRLVKIRKERLLKVSPSLKEKTHSRVGGDLVFSPSTTVSSLAVTIFD